jgi:predicted 3-demethylubiquinone-9 3-methyltransferase (glyoxalase superfamily)/quercetin dioxygenase-like cupin family protein
MTILERIPILLLAAAAAWGVPPGAAAAGPAPILPDSLAWFSPPGNPALQGAWVLGGEKEPGAYALRVRLGEGGRIPPHTHPDERFTTVLSGTLHVGFGAVTDDAAMVAVPAGGVYVAPAGVPHYLHARGGDVVYQESGRGPTATVFPAAGQPATERRPMVDSMTPFLMFEGRAEEALTFYTGLFPGAAIDSIERYRAGEMGPEGTVRLASFTVAGQRVMAIDSPADHDFTFTPSFSFFVECAGTEELDALFAALSEGGAVMMPPGDYGFSRRFCWVSDRFGVSWQLNVQ